MSRVRVPLSRRRALTLAAAAPFIAPGVARAVDAWPTKPVKYIVTFPPGGPTDTLSRIVCAELSEMTGQQFIIENRAGSGGNVGSDAIAKAAPDGYTVGLYTVASQAIAPTLYAKLPFDVEKDFSPIAMLWAVPNMLMVRLELPVKTLPELIALAKAQPGKLSFASSGAGTTPHITGELFKQMAGVNLLHVPYKGSAPAQQDVVGGRVPLLFDILYSSMPFVQDHRLKVIALSSPKRALSNPEIPLIADTLPGFSAMSSIGIIAPAGLPPALLHKISADIAQAVRSTEVTSRMAQLGLEPVGSSSEQYTAQIQQEIEKWSGIVRTAGIKIE